MIETQHGKSTCTSGKETRRRLVETRTLAQGASLRPSEYDRVSKSEHELEVELETNDHRHGLNIICRKHRS